MGFSLLSTFPKGRFGSTFSKGVFGYTFLKGIFGSTFSKGGKNEPSFVHLFSYTKNNA